MAYGVIVTVPAPIEMYDSLHRELLRRTDGEVDGLLTHIARSVPDGFQVIEVWESKGHPDRYNGDVVWLLAAQIWQDQPLSAEPTTEGFEVRGLITPAATIRR